MLLLNIKTILSLFKRIEMKFLEIFLSDNSKGFPGKIWLSKEYSFGLNLVAEIVS
ncbi:MAG: hypothetical protein JXR70_17040 [Spirochaetales bacterium]|nr:hypothetical protein [Spirochaetales bacterium]